MEESLVRNIESNKIKIFNTFINTPNTRYIKVYVSKLWNLCRMLNYTRNIKDTDNNYYLLRVKDFLCDLFLLIFSSSLNEISIHDVFNLVQMITEVGQTWMKLEIRMSSEGWVRRIENLMRYLITKINEIEILISLEKKFYTNFMDYLNFYIEYFLNSDVIKSHIDHSKYHCEEILKIIILIKNIKFIENDQSTRNTIMNFISSIKSSHRDNLESIQIICQGFDSLKYKTHLPFDLISDFYKFYIQILQNLGSLVEAENALKNLFEFIPSNSKEELECYMMNLEIVANFYPNLDSITKITDLIEIMYEHKEFNLVYLEEILIIVSNHNIFDLFLDTFISKLKTSKSTKIGSNQFTYDNIKANIDIPFLLIFIVFKSKFFSSDSIDNLNLLPHNFYEILKTLSECLLEHYSNRSYSEEHLEIIPSLLRNIVILFLRIEKSNENFSSYFLLEIIRNIKSDSGNEFIQLSLELYIEKRDFIKLKTVVRELEEQNLNTSLYFYSKLILLLSEGNRWNAHNQLNNICLSLNSTEDFHIIYYIKLFDYIVNTNTQDLSIISVILQNFANKFILLFRDKEFHRLRYQEENKILSLFEILYDIMSFVSKLNNFSGQIILFVELMNTISSFLEYSIIDDHSEYLVQDILTVVDIINILLNLKMKFEDYPEFILISLVKLLNFIFSNFFIFSKEFFSIGENKIQEQLKNMMDLVELYKNLSIFYFSYEYINIKDEDESDSLNHKKTKFLQLKNTYDRYSRNFNDALVILKNKFINSIEYVSYVEEKFENYINTTKITEQLLQIQMMTNIESESIIEESVMRLVSDKIENKKFLFVVNSILFQNGYKELSQKFIKQLLNYIMSSYQELVHRVYTIEEICMLFKDYININEDVVVKITYLKEYTAFILKLFSKTDDILINENVEWILYKVYMLLEEYYNKKNKNDKEYLMLKSIFDELNSVNFRNKSFVLFNLFDIIMKRLLI